MLDASAMVLAVSGKTDASSKLRTRLSGVRKHAPHLIDAEVGNVLRRHERKALLSDEEALLALRAARVLVDHRYAHVGPVGAGHYVKMVHNGVEYGMMQAYAEGYAILDAASLDIDVPAAIGSWQEGSVVRSWLLDLLIKALADTPDLDGIASVAADSGEGRWTVSEAVANGVAAPVISAALFARFSSQQREEDVAMKVISALRNQFGGHAIELENPVGEEH